MARFSPAYPFCLAFFIWLMLIFLLLNVTLHPRTSKNRTERLSVLISLVLSSMLAGLMFYKVTTEESSFYEYEVRIQQLEIALWTSFIESFMTNLIIFFFQKSKSLNKNTAEYLLIHEMKKEEGRENREEGHFSKLLKSPKSTVKEMTSSYLKKLIEMEPLQPVMFQYIPKKNRKDKWLILAWTICISNILFCAFFTVWLSLKVGKVKSMSWLTSVIFGYIQGIFILKPLRIVVSGILLASIYKTQPNISELIIDRREVKIYLVNQLKNTNVKDITERRKSKIYEPPTPEMIQAARKRRRAIYLQWTILIDVLLVCCIFLCMSLMLHYTKFGMQFHANKHLEAALTDPSYFHLTDPDAINFKDVTTKAKFYQYVHHTLLPALHKYTWYNKEAISESDSSSRVGWTSDYNWKLISILRLRQQRAKRVPCPSIYNTHRCYDFLEEDKGTFNTNWDESFDPLQNESEFPNNAWLYQKSTLRTVWDVGPSDFTSDFGGYLISLGLNIMESLKMLHKLEHTNWIDGGTRNIFIEFALYNPHNDFIIVVTLTVEHNSFGLYTTKSKVEIAQAAVKDAESVTSIIIVGLTFFVFYLFLVHTINTIMRSGFSTFIVKFWSLVDILLLCFLPLVVLLFALKIISSHSVEKNYRQDDLEQFLTYYTIFNYHRFLMISIGIVIFLAVIRSLKCLRFSSIFRSFEFSIYLSRHIIFIIYMFAILTIVYILLIYSLSGHSLLYGIIPTFLQNFFNPDVRQDDDLYYEIGISAVPLIIRYYIIMFFCKSSVALYYYLTRNIIAKTHHTYSMQMIEDTVIIDKKFKAA